MHKHAVMEVMELMDLACVFPPIATRLFSSRRRKKTSAAAVNVSSNVRRIKTDVVEFMTSKCWEHIGTHGVFCELPGFTAWRHVGTLMQELRNRKSRMFLFTSREENMCTEQWEHQKVWNASQRIQCVGWTLQHFKSEEVQVVKLSPWPPGSQVSSWETDLDHGWKYDISVVLQINVNPNI